MELSDAHVLVTGASRGIGAALAASFADAGARVSVAARSVDALERVAAGIGGTVFAVDLLDPDQVDDLVPRVERAAGPIDVLVNNAGLETTSWAAEIDPGLIRDVSRLNLEVPMVLTRAVLPGLLERDHGHLVYLASIAATGGFPGMSAYCATKAGVANYVASLRLELRDSGITTTLVSPGPVDTEMWDRVEDAVGLAPARNRLDRMRLLPKKSPEHIAHLTVAAVRADRRHARSPRRLTANYVLREAPGRLTEVLLTGVPTGPRRRPSG